MQRKFQAISGERGSNPHSNPAACPFRLLNLGGGVDIPGWRTYVCSREVNLPPNIINFWLLEVIMFWEKIRGDPKIGDIGHKDNKVVNMIFVAGVVVTLMACVAFLMYAFL